jgi:uncharacterized LabA/DUF88 family protein
MSKNIGIFVDVSNLYYCISKKFTGRKLNYKKYMEFMQDYGDVKIAVAYGAQLKNEARKFIHCIRQSGYIAKWKQPKVYHNDNVSLSEIRRKADWDVGLTIDVIDSILNKKINRVIIGTADGDLAPLVDWCLKRDIDVIIIATGISKDLKKLVGEDNYVEIPESLLE